MPSLHGEWNNTIPVSGRHHGALRNKHRSWNIDPAAQYMAHVTTNVKGLMIILTKILPRDMTICNMLFGFAHGIWCSLVPIKLSHVIYACSVVVNIALISIITVAPIEGLMSMLYITYAIVGTVSVYCSLWLLFLLQKLYHLWGIRALVNVWGWCEKWYPNLF